MAATAGSNGRWALGLLTAAVVVAVLTVVTSGPQPSGHGSAPQPTPSVLQSPRAAPWLRGNAFVAVEASHVVLVDATSGRTLQQLSSPTQGDVDSSPAGGGGDVVWVRAHADRCTSQIVRTSLAHGLAVTDVPAEPVKRSLATLSPDGQALGWLEAPCDGGAATVVVRDDSGRLTTVTQPPGDVDDLDVADGDWLLVSGSNGVHVLPPDGELATARRLLAARGCVLGAAAWDGDAAIAWQRCGDRQQLVRFAAQTYAPVVSVTALAGEPPVVRTRVAAGVPLLWLANARIARLIGGRLVDIPSATRLSQPSW